MQNHTKIYIKHYWENTLCKVCWNIAVDIHHIVPRSHFWKKTKYLQDDITNLIALCRTHHEQAHKNIITKEYLQWL